MKTNSRTNAVLQGKTGMTEVRTFKAANMQVALDLVRREMGAEAVILHTRQISRRRLLPWKKSTVEVEITAGSGVNVRPSPSGVRSRQRSTAMAARKKPSPRSATKSFESNLPRARVAENRLGNSVANNTNVAEEPAATTTTVPRQVSADGDTVSFSSAMASAGTVASEISQTLNAGPSPGDRTEEFAAKLDSIQKMLENLGRRTPTEKAEEIPSELFHLYTELIDAEVEEDLARELVFRLKENCRPDQLNDHNAARALLAGMVESEIRCSGPIVPTPGKRKVVALIGATGVGKTTTIAKLAANFRLRDGVKMGLVTVDTYRIAAVEQLRTYAEIIDLPMKVVTNSLEMRRALDELVGLDLVLIDTAGRSPRDDLQIQELKRLLAEADVDEVHLVLNMTASMRSLKTTAEMFAAANTTSVIVTKLDEAACLGTLLSIARNIELPISYMTTGQDVPADIEPAAASRIARLVLGEERISD